MKSLLLIIVTLITLAAQSDVPGSRELTFEVRLKSKSIGIITATRTETTTHQTSVLHTNTSSKMMMITVHLESEVTTVREQGILTEGKAYRHANRGIRDMLSHFWKTEVGYSIIHNGDTLKHPVQKIEMCIVDLYFHEPKNLTTVFSTMYSKELPVKGKGSGQYEVTTPDGKVSLYTYRNDALIRIETDSPLGKITTEPRGRKK